MSASPFEIEVNDSEGNHTPPQRVPQFEVLNDWLVDRGVYEGEYPGGAAYGMLPYSDAEPLCNLSDVDGYLGDHNPRVAALIERAKAEALNEAADDMSKKSLFVNGPRTETPREFYVRWLRQRAEVATRKPTS